MGRLTLVVRGYFLEYSTTSDSPVIFGMNYSDYMDWYREEYGRAGMREFDIIVQRALNGGIVYAKDVLSTNRAGKNERHLSIDNVYKAYCLRQDINGWTPDLS
jgi:hypothetical protein